MHEHNGFYFCFNADIQDSSIRIGKTLAHWERSNIEHAMFTRSASVNLFPCITWSSSSAHLSLVTQRAMLHEGVPGFQRSRSPYERRHQLRRIQAKRSSFSMVVTNPKQLTIQLCILAIPPADVKKLLVESQQPRRHPRQLLQKLLQKLL